MINRREFMASVAASAVFAPYALENLATASTVPPEPECECFKVIEPPPRGDVIWGMVVEAEVSRNLIIRETKKYLVPTYDLSVDDFSCFPLDHYTPERGLEILAELRLCYWLVNNEHTAVKSFLSYSNVGYWPINTPDVIPIGGPEFISKPDYYWISLGNSDTNDSYGAVIKRSNWLNRKPVLRNGWSGSWHFDMTSGIQEEAVRLFRETAARPPYVACANMFDEASLARIGLQVNKVYSPRELTDRGFKRTEGW